MTLAKNLFLFLLFAATIAFVGCGDDKEECTTTCTGQLQVLDTETCTCVYDIDSATEEVLDTEITQDKTLSANKVYYLTAKTYVKDGATLTIEPGTIIKGFEGSGTNSSALVIARGGKINACGTAAKPIIFTSILDNIKVGEKSGTNLTKEDREKWGGLIVLGYAPISAKDGDTESQIEGIPADVEEGKFGGSNPADNSGSICYVSIRHGGSLLGGDNEINGLTLGGVGNGTKIENIEIVGNLDDGVEFFGGTVNLKNVLVAYQGDDAIDIDMNYAGTVDNIYIIHGGDDTDEAFEIDGPEGSTYTDGKFTVLNATAIAEDQTKTSGVDFKSKAQGVFRGVSLKGYKPGKVFKTRASFNDDCTNKTDAYTNFVSGDLSIVNNMYITTEGSTDDLGTVYVDKDASDAAKTCLENSGFQAVLDEGLVDNNNVAATSSTSGANTSVFSWTWSASNNLVE